MCTIKECREALEGCIIEDVEWGEDVGEGEEGDGENL